jgi:hypothetical protein
METTIKESGRTISPIVREFMLEKIRKENTKEVGSMVSNRVKELNTTEMVRFILEISKKVLKMGKEKWYTRMVHSTRVIS